MIAHHNARPMPTERRIPGTSPGTDTPSVFAAVVIGLPIGVVLGWWCRVFAYSNSVNGVLANLGAPWVVAAFVSGAVVARSRHARPLESTPHHAGAALCGSLAGTVCLVVATVVYYGPARNGTFAFQDAAVRTVFWSIVSVAVGVVFGAAGALWRCSPHDSARAAGLVVLGTAITGEAGYLMAVGATEHDGFALDVVLAVAVIGIVAPLLLGRRRPRSRRRDGRARAASPASVTRVTNHHPPKKPSNPERDTNSCRSPRRCPSPPQ